MPAQSTARVAQGSSAIEAFRGYAAAFQKLDAGEVARHFKRPLS